MMKGILNNWSVMRGLRLVIGIIALVQSIIQKDITLGIIAAFLLVTAIANVGCCGSNGCAVNFNKHKKENEILYEQLDNKK